MIETDRGLVAIWLDEQNLPLGMMVGDTDPSDLKGG
jgi:hypothetical protein